VLEDRQAPATLTVNSSADTANPTDPYLSLREAVAIVNSPSLPDGLSPEIRAQIDGQLHEGQTDSVVFDPAAVFTPIVLGGSQLHLSLPASTAAVTIEGGAAGVTIDGNNASRILQVDSGVQATLDHLTIVHGRAPGSGATLWGGGIVNAGTLTVSHSSITANTASTAAGGVYSTGTLTVTDSTVSNNLVTASSSFPSGGGIYTDGGTLTVSHSILTANTAPDGGGLFIGSGGQVTVTDSTLGSNVGRAGGGIYIYSSVRVTVTVSDSVLTSNRAQGGIGGGIANIGGSMTVSDSTLTSNSSGLGGAISNYTGGTMMVTDSVLSGNYGGGIANGSDFGPATLAVRDCTLESNSGGGIYNFSGATLTVSNSTLGSNSASSGGGIGIESGTATVTSCTLTANSAQDGAGLANLAGTLDLRNTIVAGNRGPQDLTGSVTSGSHNLVGGDPRLSPPGNYGGPTRTYALLPDSPARNAGDPASADTTDQRNLLRDPNGPIDIGAFQTQQDPFLVTTLADPGRLPGLLSLREAVALANVLPGDHTVSFSDALDGGAVRLTAGQLELSGTGGVTTIDGAGRFTLDGGGATRLVQVDPGTTAVLRGLALVNGNASIGAGVYNQGTLTVADCVLYGNVAYSGGAVQNQGDLTVAGCTLAFNVATIGGAIDNEGMLTAYNSTLLYNAALAAGGAILNQPSGTAFLTSLTVSLNSADTGGGLDVAGGLVLLRNCIVAGNYTTDAGASSDIAGMVARTSTYNLIGIGGSGGLLDGVGHNRVGVADPGLTTPDFSGPQTPAFGLSSASPALAAGDPTLLDDPLLSLDQHGNVRTVVNIGAV
jgi:hypothetical protein